MLRGELEAAQSIIEDYENRMAELTKNLEKSANRETCESVKLEETKKVSENRLTEVELENKLELESVQQSSEHQNEEFASRDVDAAGKVEELKVTVAQLELRLVENEKTQLGSTEQLCRLKLEIENLEETLENAVMDKEAAMEEVEELRTKMGDGDTSSDVGVLLKASEKKVEELEAAINILKIQLEENSVARMQLKENQAAAAEEAESKIKEGTELLQASGLEVKKLEDVVASLKKQLEGKVESDLSTSSNVAVGAEMAEDQDELMEEVEAQVGEDAEAIVKYSREVIDRLEAEATQLKSRLDKQTEALAKLIDVEDQLKSSRAEIEELKITADCFKNDLKHEQEEGIEQAQKLCAAKLKLAETEQLVKSTKTEIEDLLIAQESLKTKADEAEAHSEVLKDVTAKLTDAELALAASRTEVAMTKQKVSSLESKVVDLDAKLLEVQSKLEETESTKSLLENKLKSFEEEEELKSVELQVAVVKLQDDLTSMEEVCQGHKIQVSNLEAEISKVNVSLEIKTEEMEAKNMAMAELEAKNFNQFEHLASVKKELKIALVNLENTTAVIASKEKTIENRMEVVGELEEKIGSCRSHQRRNDFVERKPRNSKPMSSCRSVKNC